MRDAALLSRPEPAERRPGVVHTSHNPAWEAWAAPVLLAVVVVAVHLWLVSQMRAPVVQADEFGYLYGAHYLALGGPPPATPGYPVAPYFPGYSLLLVPLWWMSRVSAHVYHQALLVNTALAGLASVLAYALAGRLSPGLSPRVRALIGLVVAAYPAYMGFADVAESENLLVPAFLGLCLLARRAFAHPGVGIWAGLGLAAGALYAVHPSALAVAVAVAVVGGWVSRPWSLHRSRLAALGAGLVLGLGLARALVAYVTAGGPSDSTGVASAAGRQASPSGLVHLGVEAAGQLLYLLAGTAGLVVMALSLAGGAAWVVARRREANPSGPAGRHRRRRINVLRPDLPGSRARYQTVALVMLSALVMLVVSVVSVGGQGKRLDSFLYGRYLDGILAPLLVIGLLVAVGLRRRATRPRRGWVVIGGLVGLAASAAVVVAGRGQVVRGVVVADNVLAVHALFRASTTATSLNLVVLAAAGALLLVWSVLAWRRSLLLGALVVVAAFAPSTVVAQADLAHQSRGTLAQQVVADTLVALHSHWGATAGCVGYDLVTNDAFSFVNDRLFDPEQRFVPFDSRHGGRPCSDEVVSGRRDLATSLPGIRQVLPGNGDGQGLWVGPGPLQDRLARAGWLFPPGGLGALPAGAEESRVSLDPGQPLSLALSPGGTAKVALHVTHLGGGAPWPNVAGLGRDALAVRVAAPWVRIRTGAGGVSGQPPAVVAQSVGDLPSTLLPGQTAPVSVALLARGLNGRPLAPGRYRVRLELEQQGAAIFPSRPGSSVVLVVTVG